MAAPNVSAPARPAAKIPETAGRPAGGPAAAPIDRTPDPEFPGCKAVPMSREAVSRYEGRFEFWSARSGMA